MVVYAVGMQIVSIFSVLCSLSVVLTLCFRSLRKKLFMQIIAWIALSDLIANLGYCSIRRPHSNSPLCSLEGFVNLYFYPVSWMWSTVLMALLNSLATTGKLPLSYLSLHVICWIFPFILSIFNFASNSGGASTKETGNYSYEVCTLGDSKPEKIYHVITYYGLWIACVLFMLVMYLRIRSMDKVELKSNFPMWQNARDTLILYPLALLICWMPHVVAVLLAYFAPFSGLNAFYFSTDVMKVLHGSVTAVIFFYKSTEARNRWMKFFVNVGAGLGLLVSDTDDWTVVTDFSVEYASSVDHSSQGSVDGGVIPDLRYLNDDTMAWCETRNSGGSAVGSGGKVLSDVGSAMHSGEDGRTLRDSELELA